MNVFSPAIARRMQQQTHYAYKTKPGSSPLDRKLTARELEVLRLIVEGKPNKGTAHALGISIKTVEKHRQSLMDKLNIHETASLVRYAIGKGLVPCVGLTEDFNRAEFATTAAQAVIDAEVEFVIQRGRKERPKAKC